jgi:hypothetical protein
MHCNWISRKSKNDTFKETHVVDEKQGDEEVSNDKPTPKPMSKNEKEKFLEKN